MCCYKYWENIEHISEEIENYDYEGLDTYNLETAIPILDEIEVIAHDKEIAYENAKHILDDDKMKESLDNIRDFYVNIGTHLEINQTKEILNADDPWKKLDSFHFFKRYKKLVTNEKNLASLKKGDRLAFVGGGPLPLTLIMFNKYFGIKGISIEIIPEVVEISKKVLAKLGLSDEIEVVQGDENTINSLDYDVLMIAAFAEPKKRVFENVKHYIKSDTKILYRTYSGMRAILYSPINIECLDGYTELGRVYPTGKVNNTSVLVSLDEINSK